MIVKGKEYCRCKLLIWGHDLDPQRVTELLKTKPDVAYRAGDRSYKLKPDGTRDLTRPTRLVHRVGRWARAIHGTAKNWTASGQLAYWNDFLTKRKTAIRTLLASGYKIEVDCYIDEGPIVYVEMAPALMAGLGSLGISVRLAFYDGTSVELRAGQKARRIMRRS